jgi:hypothetical protein
VPIRPEESITAMAGADSRSVYDTGGWWHLNWGGWSRGNGWSGINEMVSNTWFPCYEPPSLQQPPLVYRVCLVCVHSLMSAIRLV